MNSREGVEKRELLTLLVGMQTNTATMKNSVQPCWAYILQKRDTCTPVFIAALFSIARTWKQPRCLSTDEGINKPWYV